MAKAAGTGGRVAMMNATGSIVSRRAANASTSPDGPSSQCASSTAHTTGPDAATVASSDSTEARTSIGSTSCASAGEHARSIAVR